MSNQSIITVIQEGLTALTQDLNEPIDVPRIGWAPIQKELITELYEHISSRIIAEINEAVAYGTKRLATEDVGDAEKIDEAAAFFRDTTERLRKLYAENYYYTSRRFYPPNSIEDPDSDDSDYEQQLAEHNHYMSLPDPVPSPVELLEKYADCGEDAVHVAYQLYDTLLHTLHTTASGYAVYLQEKIEHAASTK